eukprot:1393932-Amphidinium_carterae.1
MPVLDKAAELCSSACKRGDADVRPSSVALLDVRTLPVGTNAEGKRPAAAMVAEVAARALVLVLTMAVRSNKQPVPLSHLPRALTAAFKEDPAHKVHT